MADVNLRGIFFFWFVMKICNEHVLGSSISLIKMKHMHLDSH